MTLVNADGGAAEMSGNGIRCLAWVAARAGLGHGDALVVDTGGGRRTSRARARRRRLRRRRRGRHGRGHLRAHGDPGRRSTTVRPRCRRRRRVVPRRRCQHRQPAPRAASSTTRPPCRVAVARADHRARRALPAPHQRRVRRGDARRTRIAMRVWERGAGETLSCGTGACAVAAVAHRRGLVGESVQVDVPGGELSVDARRDRAPRRSGRARVRRRRTDRRGRVRSSTCRPPHQDRQRRRLTATEVDLERVRQQRALLVGTGVRHARREEAEASLDELALLADTAGAEPVRRELQRRTTPDPATYIGKGKAEELRELARRARRRRRDLRRRAHARAAAQPREAVRASTSSTASR